MNFSLNILFLDVNSLDNIYQLNLFSIYISKMRPRSLLSISYIYDELNLDLFWFHIS